MKSGNEIRSTQDLIEDVAPFSEPLQELLSTDPGSRVHAELHVTHLLINLLHEMNDKVDKLVPQHLLGVKVSYEEADVIALNILPPQDDEVFRASHHEPHELVTEQLLHVVRLLDC